MIARIIDVSIGTVRTICVVKNLKTQAVILGFFESLIWVLAIGKVASNLDKPIYIFAYALGYAIGNYSGLTIEKRMALGSQVLRVFTKRAEEIRGYLREQGVGVTTFSGEGHAGVVNMLLLKLKRKQVPGIVRSIRELDPEVFYFVDDIGEASDTPIRYYQRTGWRAWSKKV